MARGEYKMPSVAVSVAKNNLPSLRREALTGKEILLEDAKRKDDHPVSLIATSLIDELCEKSVIFSYKWIDEPTDESPHYSLWNNETGVYGVGTTKAEAIEDYVGNIKEYASVYFSDLPFYLSPSGKTRSHYWYLRRVLRCGEDTEALFKALNIKEIS